MRSASHCIHPLHALRAFGVFGALLFRSPSGSAFTLDRGVPVLERQVRRRTCAPAPQRNRRGFMWGNTFVQAREDDSDSTTSWFQDLARGGGALSSPKLPASHPWHFPEEDVRIDIQHHHTVTSTQTLAEEEARELARSGLLSPHSWHVISSESQTQGLGTFDIERGSHRTWSSPEGGNIYMTVVFGLPSSKRHLSLYIAQVTTLAIVRALREITPLREGLSVKWVNDVLYERQKLCGVLSAMPGVDNAAGAEDCTALLLGIGMNVASMPDRSTGGQEGLQATTLVDALRSTMASEVKNRRPTTTSCPFIDVGLLREWVKYRLLSHLASAVSYLLRENSFDAFVPDVSALLAFKGEIVAVDGGSDSGGFEARVLGVDRHGGLQIEDAKTLQRRSLTTGRVRPMYNGQK